MTYLKYAQMLCSRLCHDLISPIGAINSGLEILDDCDEESKIELMQLTVQSAETAAQRLTFYRAAFGYSVAMHFSSLDNVEKAINKFLKSTKVEFKWREHPDHKVLENYEIEIPEIGRILTNLVLLLVEIAPYGAVLNISSSLKQDSLTFALHINGKLVQMRKENFRALCGDLNETELSAHNIQAFMTHELISEQNIQMQVNNNTPQSFSVELTKSLEQSQQTASLFS